MFSENWPETQRRDWCTRANWLKGGFLLVNQLVTWSDFTFLLKNVANTHTHTQPTCLFYCCSVCSTNLLHFYSLCFVHAQHRRFPLMRKNFKELNDLQKCIVLTWQWPTFYPVLTDSRPRKSHWCDWKWREILRITE